MITVCKYYKSKQRSNHFFIITTWLKLLIYKLTSIKVYLVYLQVYVVNLYRVKSYYNYIKLT